MSVSMDDRNHKLHYPDHGGVNLGTADGYSLRSGTYGRTLAGAYRQPFARAYRRTLTRAFCRASFAGTYRRLAVAIRGPFAWAYRWSLSGTFRRTFAWAYRYRRPLSGMLRRTSRITAACPLPSLPAVGESGSLFSRQAASSIPFNASKIKKKAISFIEMTGLIGCQYSAITIGQ